MAEILFVRHGVTAWNRDGRFQGQIDIALDDEGHRQARLTGERLASEARERPVAAVYASDLSRARQTAQPIAAALRLPACEEPLLRERHYGAFQGCTHAQLQLEHGDAYRRWRARDPDFALPGGGESLRGFHARVERALAQLASRHAGETIVAVTHGGVLDSVYRIATGLELTAPRRHELLNASINRVAWNGRAFELRCWADVAHLERADDDIEARA